MATYTDLSGSTDSGDPITTTLMTALRDNPVAIAEGNAGASDDIYIETAGIRDNAVTRAKIQDAQTSNTNGATTSTYVGLPIAKLEVTGNRSANNLFDAYSAYITVYRAGTYTCHLTANGQDNDIRVACELYINDVYVTETAGAVTANTYLHHVVTLAEGDTIRIRSHRVGGDDPGNTFVNLDLVCDNPLSETRPASFIQTSYGTTTTTNTRVADWT